MKKTLLIGALVLVVLLVIGGSVLGTLYLTGKFPAQESAQALAETEAGEELQAQAQEAGSSPATNPQVFSYVALDPPFTVSFHAPTTAQFLQVSVEAAVESKEVEDALKTHAPAIRNAMVMLLSGQNADELQSREGKEALRGRIREEIRSVLSDLIGQPGVVDVFFTTFLMQ